jgi:hypothetical protein
MTEWETNFVTPILKSAGDYPDVFLEILARKAQAHPDLIPVFAEALKDMAAWYQAEAAGLRAVKALRTIAKAQGGQP